MDFIMEKTAHKHNLDGNIEIKLSTSSYIESMRREVYT